jgi:hypothetical protein
MTDEDCARVLEIVEQARERREFGFPEEKFGLTDRFFKGVFTRAVRQLGGRCPLNDVAVACGLCVVGPAEAGIPPARHRATILAALLNSFGSEETADHTRRALEFAVAYGCGWKRDLFPQASGVSDWDTTWWYAEQALLLASGVPAVKRCREWLDRLKVMSIPSDATAMDVPVEHRDAEYLDDAWELLSRYRTSERALRRDVATVEIVDQNLLLDGSPLDVRKLVMSTGSEVTLFGQVHRQVDRVSIHLGDEEPFVRVVFARRPHKKGPQPDTRYAVSAGDTILVRVPASAGVSQLTIRGCTCDTDPCMNRHRLAAWEPTEQRLWSHFERAVSGGSLKVGDFLGSMLFALYRDQGHVNEIFSGLYVCSAGERTAFPSCRNPEHEKVWRIIARKSFRGSGSTTWYKKQLFCCKNGAGHVGPHEPEPKAPGKSFYNYYDSLDEQPQCPRCGARPGRARRTTMWFLHSVSTSAARELAAGCEIADAPDADEVGERS